MLLKSNQCGTLTELIAAAAATRALGWNTIQSGRSGESEDVTPQPSRGRPGSDQIKVGSMARSERTAKWNEVIRIEEKIRLSAIGSSGFRELTRLPRNTSGELGGRLED